MSREKLIEEVAERVIRVKPGQTAMVAIDGISASGKTSFANELAAKIREIGRPAIRISVDDFLNEKAVRYKRGRLSAEGYYRDSFDYEALRQLVLFPLTSKGNRTYKPVYFDLESDTRIDNGFLVAPEDAALIFDGVFAMRSELVDFWDFSILLDVAFAVSLKRAIKRDSLRLGSEEETIVAYKKRYGPGEKLYFEEARPKEMVSMIIDNNELSNPSICKQGSL